MVEHLARQAELDEEESVSSDKDTEVIDNIMGLFNPSDIDIAVEPKSLDALIERIQHNEIDMNTDFQRHADLWNKEKMSRLIESILIRFPLPAFYFDASDESNWLIVDGLQRLSSIRKFVIEKELSLTGLEFLKDLDGQYYHNLHRKYQRRIRECQVTAYMIKPGTPDKVKYSVFRRINTGGLTLNNQEIRNALAKPKDRQLLEELASLKKSKLMMGDLSKRMKDQELVLRFWAFYKFDYFEPGNKKELAPFLDKAMEEIKKGGDQYRENVKSQYSKAINRCLKLLGNSGFQKKPPSDSRKLVINSCLFEVWMVSLAKLEKDQFDTLVKKKDIFKEKVESLLNDSEFMNVITYATQKASHVKTRHEKVKQLIDEVSNA